MDSGKLPAVDKDYLEEAQQNGGICGPEEGTGDDNEVEGKECLLRGDWVFPFAGALDHGRPFPGGAFEEVDRNGSKEEAGLLVDQSLGAFDFFLGFTRVYNFIAKGRLKLFEKIRFLGLNLKKIQVDF